MQDFTQTTADWRGVIRRNNRASYCVILIFILMYVALGLLIDTFIYSERYFMAPIGPIFYKVITLQLFPYATIISTLIAIISLCVVFMMHDKLMLLGTEYREITPENAQNLQEKQFYNVIEEMKIAAGLTYMPKVYIIDADYMNAFASGYSQKSAMVAITRGLLEKLDRDEIQAVMAHELSHIRHMDIKLTLMASLLSNIMLVIIDVLFWNAYYSSDGSNRRREGSGASWLMLVIVVLRFLLPLVNMMLLLFLSRRREYMADAGCVELTRNNEPLARALMKIQNDTAANVEDYDKQYNQSTHDALRREAYIFDPTSAGIGTHSSFSEFFSTHPSLENRLAALGFKQKN